MKEKLTIVKVGGAVVEDDVQLTRLVKDFHLVKGAKMLVHGGGRRATKVAAQLGIETVMIEGRRVTSREMLDVVTMVYGGLVNKLIVGRLQNNGVNAIGLTGADGYVIRSSRRPPVSLPSGEVVDYGFVGDVQGVNAERLAQLIDAGMVPVIAPLSFDGESLLNTNADTMASETAKAMAAMYDVTLVYAFEKAGVLARPDDDTSVIPHIGHADFDRLKAEGVISGGMVPKVQNALAAVDAGVNRVVITSAKAIDGLHGTVISNRFD